MICLRENMNKMTEYKGIFGVRILKIIRVFIVLKVLRVIVIRRKKLR